MDLNTDAEQIRKIIQDEMNLHVDKVVVLRRVFKKAYDEELLGSLAKQWIDHYLRQSEPLIEKWLSERYYKLLKVIMDEYKHDRNMIALWKNNPRIYCWVNWRYVLTIEQNEETNNVLMYLMDNLCNEERTIQIDNLNLPETEYFCIHFLKHLKGSLFMVYFEILNGPSLICVLNVDLEQMKCECITKTEVYLPDPQSLVIDESNWRNILFYKREIVELAEESIRLFNLNRGMDYFKLMGDTLHVYLNEFQTRDTNDVDIVKVTVDLTSGIAQEEVLLQFEGPPSETDRYHSLVLEGRWVGSKFYRFNAFGSHEEGSLILIEDLKIIDIEAKTVVKRLMHFTGRIYKIHVDQNEFITLIMRNQGTGDMETHRIPIREPDSLKNLALFALTRRLRECGRTFSETLAPQLPDKLKPFYMVKDLL